jgi:hypothetical protein
LKRKNALVGPVLVGQELAERVRILDGRRLQRLEAVALEDLADGGQHAVPGADVVRAEIEKPLGSRAVGPVFLLDLAMFVNAV